MSKLFLLLACGLTALSVGAQSTGRTPWMQKSFPLAQVHTVTSETSGGNITVEGVTSGEARVEVYIHSNNDWNNEISKEEIQKRLDEQFDLDVSLAGNELRARARHKEHFNDWRHSLSISFKIFVPEAVSTSLRTSGGNISITDVNGTQDFRTSGGNLDLSKLSGRIIGRTSGGNVMIADSKNDIDLSTSGGNMEAIRCDGTIRLGTSGGNITLHGVNGTINGSTSGGQIKGDNIAGEFRTRTSGGDIRLEDISCSLSASTSGGNIDVSMKSPGKYVDLSDHSGDITLTLPDGQGLNLDIRGETIHKGGTLHNFSGSVDEHHIDGTLNGGGVPVRVDAGGATVHLSFK